METQRSFTCDVTIDNKTRKVMMCSTSDEEGIVPISDSEVQTMVDKLFEQEMITPQDNDDEINVGICVWRIDESDQLYIETYHVREDDEPSDDDRTMLYDDFLNS